MKLTPDEKNIMDRMQAGILSMEGFLGDDKRHIHEIIEDDNEVLLQLHKTPEEIAERMQYFTDNSKEAYETPLLIDKKYLVQQDIWRGRVICPFNHRGTYPKATVYLTNTQNNISIVWTPLNIHFIKEHTFFEGKGSKYRLNPDLLIKALF